MHLPPLSRLLIVLVLVTGGAAMAQPQRKLQSFEGEVMTQEQRDAARSKSKYNINSYGKDIPVKDEPFPWMALGLAGLVFVVVSPFAYRAYKSTAKEMSQAHVFGVSSSREGAEDEQA
jgi:hypothetical protein